MSVKRYSIDCFAEPGKMLVEHYAGHLVKASDYDALASVCRELLCEVPDRSETKAKAIALLDGEKNEGVR